MCLAAVTVAYDNTVTNVVVVVIVIIKWLTPYENSPENVPKINRKALKKDRMTASGRLTNPVYFSFPFYPG